MVKKVQLTLVIHNHQPVGNFDSVIADACRTAYLPFLKELLAFPNVKIGLHTSGCLWEWMQSNCREYIDVVRELVSRGQVELVGGGMYEPILPILPERDALWQLERMNRYIEEHFGVVPEGMWCPERVWEPHMPRMIASSGLAYTLLDDHHFNGAADPAKIKTEYFVTEHEGHLVSLLPISKKLRYTIPFKPVKATIDHLKELAETSTRTPLVVFGDDGEKFGVWPDTYEWVYEKGWLSEFFTALTENLDWIDLIHARDVVRKRRPDSKVFLPCSSYTEMGEWSRINVDAKEDDPPGFWRNYQVKYSESNQIYRRMLHVSAQLNTAREYGFSAEQIDGIAHELGRAQCNCAYWHGIFGGLYLNYLRQALYHHLIRAESGLRQVMPWMYEHQAVRFDHDGLGWDQVLLQNDKLAVLADPGNGLCITRIDYRPTSYCWSDVLTKRREAYHDKVWKATIKEDENDSAHESIHERILAKERGLDDYLVVDPHPRVSFTTYFGKITDPAGFLTVKNYAKASNLLKNPDYGLQAKSVSIGGSNVSGKVDVNGLRLVKKINLDNNKLLLEIMVESGDLKPELGDFFIEFNLTALTNMADDRYLLIDSDRHSLADTVDTKNANSVVLVDGWQNRRLSIQSQHPMRVLGYPVSTISNSEGGFEKTYQGSSIILGFDVLALAGGISLELAIEELT